MEDQVQGKLQVRSKTQNHRNLHCELQGAPDSTQARVVASRGNSALPYKMSVAIIAAFQSTGAA